MEVCYPKREEEAAWAAYERLHTDRPWHNGDMSSWVKDPDAEHPYHFRHGVTVWIAAEDFGHGGAFTTRENPFSGAATEQADGDDDEAADTEK